MFSKIIASIESYDVITIFGHTSPDGDCYGSLNGLKNIIETTFPKKRVFCLTSYVESLVFIGKMDVIDNHELEGALAIVCDTSTRERIADQRYKLCKEIRLLGWRTRWRNSEMGWTGCRLVNTRVP